MSPHDREFLDEAARGFRRFKKLADRALSQVSDDDFFATLDAESNSLAVIVKHLAGNLRSRWTDFLTTDGEKPDRRRDSEFLIEPEDTRASLLDRWEAGFQVLSASLESLGPDDLERTVAIRGEPHTVIQAMNRQLTHFAYHVGQIVLLAKHFAGPRWETLSIPRGKSEQVNAAMRATGSTRQARKP